MVRTRHFQLNADYQTTFSDPGLNTSFPSYGKPVLAVADATVVAAFEQYSDQIADAATGITLENAEGNHVILDLADGRPALYTHLKPGSITVRKGERIRQG